VAATACEGAASPVSRRDVLSWALALLVADALLLSALDVRVPLPAARPAAAPQQPPPPPPAAAAEPGPGLLGAIVLEYAPTPEGLALQLELLPQFRTRQRLSSASAEALTAIPRLGPATAERIVRRREEAGPFRHPDELLSVRGIGEATYRGMREFLTLDRTLAVGADDPAP
jgi:hypothetical protein